MTLRATLGSHEPAVPFGSLGEAGRHLDAEFEEGVKVERRGVGVAGHGGEEPGDVERRVGSNPLGGRRDSTRQPRFRAPTSG